MDKQSGDNQKPLKHHGIDLHIHSNASDGVFSPLKIIQKASELELRAIALTDHDTVEGVRKFASNDVTDTVEWISGVEVSSALPQTFESQGSFHILGYGFDCEDPFLNQTLKRLQSARADRNPVIIERLNHLGFSLTLNEVIEEVGKAQIGRPHIAQLLLKKEIVGSIQEAFDLYLGKNKPAYVNKYQLPCDAAIKMIGEAGGISVLAHPSLLDIKDVKVFERLILILKEMGLKGIEVYYPNHTHDLQKYYMETAHRYNLLMTGGTDFHGAGDNHIQMGSGHGNFYVPYDLYETLIKTKSAIES